MVSYKISPSSLSLFKECKLCFWLEKNKYIKRPEGKFSSLPSGIDKVIKMHFNKHLHHNTKPKELSMLDEDIKLFSNKEVLKKCMTYIEWIDYEGNVLNGKIDYLLEDKDGRAIVIDFKTRGYEIKEQNDNDIQQYKLQLELYALLLEKNNIKTSNIGYLLYFYPKEIQEDGSFVFGIKEKKLWLNTKNAEKVFYEAIETLKGDMPKANPECEYCKWIEKRRSLI